MRARTHGCRALGGEEECVRACVHACVRACGGGGGVCVCLCESVTVRVCVHVEQDGERIGEPCEVVMASMMHNRQRVVKLEYGTYMPHALNSSIHRQ